MLIGRIVARFLFVIGLLLLLAACGGGQTANSNNTTRSAGNGNNAASDSNGGQEEAADNSDTSAQNDSQAQGDNSEQAPQAIEGLTGDQHLLAWVAPASAPGEQGSSAAGEVVFFNADGTQDTVLTLPNSTSQVTACGPNGESPDGSHFVFIATVTQGGSESGTIYLMHGSSSELTTVAEDVNPADCNGSAPLAFSSDSSHFAFIAWPDNASQVPSPTGRLHVLNSADGSELANIENVTTFGLTEEGAAFVSFFTNNDGEATEAAISTWNGSSTSEVATLPSDVENDCYYTSASIAEVSTGLMAIMGYKCNLGDNTNTQWQFYVIDPANSTAQLEQSDNTGGRYFAFSDTNAIFVSPDGESVLFTVPDGVNNQSVSLMATSVSEISPAIVLERFGLMSSRSDMPYDANNSTAILSSDGRWLAIVANDGNNNAVLHIFDLSDISLPPIMYSLADQGETFNSMVFAPDNSALYFVGGGDEGDNNSLFKIDLETGSDSRVSRGRYAQMVISPDGTTLAVMNWVEFDAEEPRYLTLEMYDLSSNSTTTIFEGGEVVDGKLQNPRFAYPLSWRG